MRTSRTNKPVREAHVSPAARSMCLLGYVPFLLCARYSECHHNFAFAGRGENTVPLSTIECSLAVAPGAGL